jgi:hypothetical protein
MAFYGHLPGVLETYRESSHFQGKQNWIWIRRVEPRDLESGVSVKATRNSFAQHNLRARMGCGKRNSDLKFIEWNVGWEEAWVSGDRVALAASQLLVGVACPTSTRKSLLLLYSRVRSPTLVSGWISPGKNSPVVPLSLQYLSRARN